MLKQNLKRMLVSATTCILMLVSTCTVTLAETQENFKENESVKYWAQKFPKFNEALEDGSLTGLVNTNTVYLKYDKDDTKNDCDLEGEIYTEDEYLYERNKKTFRTVISDFEKDGGKDPSWLRLDLQVYTTSTPGTYMVYSYWEWKTKPVCTFTDINGIYVSSEMSIAPSTPSTPKASCYIAYDSYGNEWYEENSIKSSQFGNGIASTIDLLGNSELFSYTNHMGMTQTPVKFTNSSSTSGVIYTNYVHSQVALGSISFNQKGQASFGLTISTDEHGGAIYIDR